MMKEARIPGYMTTAEAAKATGLSAHRIGCLARAGEIDAAKGGNTILVDAVSLQSYAMANQGRGRPLSAKTAYGALWLLSDRKANWLTYAQRRRLELRLLSVAAEPLSWQLRKRAEVKRFRASESFLPAIADSLLLSGVSSRILREFGLLQTKNTIEGYCHEADVEKIEDFFFLAEDTQGNVAIHSASWLPDDALDEMPVGVVAADLAQSLDARERAAGLAMIERLLDDYRQI